MSAGLEGSNHIASYPGLPQRGDVGPPGPTASKFSTWSTVNVGDFHITKTWRWQHHFFWKGSQTDVEWFCKMCDVCTTRKDLPGQSKALTTAATIWGNGAFIILFSDPAAEVGGSPLAGLGTLLAEVELRPMDEVGRVSLTPAAGSATLLSCSVIWWFLALWWERSQMWCFRCTLRPIAIWCYMGTDLPLLW